MDVLDTWKRYACGHDLSVNMDQVYSMTCQSIQAVFHPRSRAVAQRRFRRCCQIVERSVEFLNTVDNKSKSGRIGFSASGAVGNGAAKRGDAVEMPSHDIMRPRGKNRGTKFVPLFFPRGVCTTVQT